MENSEYFLSVLSEMKEKADTIQGLWNGDNSGRVEERAMAAQELHQKCNEIIELINELND